MAQIKNSDMSSQQKAELDKEKRKEEKKKKRKIFFIHSNGFSLI